MRFRCGVADNATAAINSHLILASIVDCVAHIWWFICEPIYFRWKNAEHKLSQYVHETERHIQTPHQPQRYLFGARGKRKCCKWLGTNRIRQFGLSLARLRSFHHRVLLDHRPQSATSSFIPLPLSCDALVSNSAPAILCRNTVFLDNGCVHRWWPANSLWTTMDTVNRNIFVHRMRLQLLSDGGQRIYIEFLTVHLLLSGRNNWSIFPCVMVCVYSVCFIFTCTQSPPCMHIHRVPATSTGRQVVERKAKKNNGEYINTEAMHIAKQWGKK